MLRRQRPETEEKTENEAAAEAQTAEEAPVESKEVTALKEQIAQLQTELEQTKDQMLRTMADFQNYRKRQQQEAETTRQYATERLITMLLPVLDNFERSIASLDSGANPEAVMNGVRAVDRQLRTILESHNVTRIPSVGSSFDPDVHEALAAEASEEHPEGTVLAELEPGYRLSEKVIRPARVKVSRKP